MGLLLRNGVSCGKPKCILVGVPFPILLLNSILAANKKASRYTLLPAQFIREKILLKPTRALWLGKRELIVAPAWQIREHDPDIVAIKEEKEPIIPDSVKNTPIIQALRRFSKHKARE